MATIGSLKPGDRVKVTITGELIGGHSASYGATQNVRDDNGHNHWIFLGGGPNDAVTLDKIAKPKAADVLSRAILRDCGMGLACAEEAPKLVDALVSAGLLKEGA